MSCRSFRSGTLAVLAMLLTVPSFAASRGGSSSGGFRSSSPSPSFRSSSPSPSFRPSLAPSMPAPMSRPVVSTPAPSFQPTPRTTVTTPVTPRSSFNQATPGVAATVVPKPSLKPTPTVTRPVTPVGPTGSFKPGVAPGMAAGVTPRGSFQRPVPGGNGIGGPSFRRSLPTASRIPSAYATRTPVTTRTYVYNGSPMVANYYGGFSGYSYAWGHPAWYMSTPFHPAFFVNPPVVANGQMYPGGFNFAKFFFGLIIWCGLLYLAWRLFFARRVAI